MAGRSGLTMANILGEAVHFTRLFSEAVGKNTLCPGGSERTGRLIETGRVDPLARTTHRFPFQDIEKAFRMMQTKGDEMIEPMNSFATP